MSSQKKEPDIKSNKEQKQDIKIIRTKPKIESKKEDKLDIEMMKTEPDTKKITCEEEKTALILGITSIIYHLSMVDIETIYLLLIFVIKYVYIKTPTPVISVHKF